MFILYDVKSTCVVSSHATLRGARISLSAIRKREARREERGRREYEVTDKEDYTTNVVKKIMVTNLMSGKLVEIDSNTPYSCRVDSESYWSS